MKPIKFMFENIHQYFLQFLPNLSAGAWEPLTELLVVKSYKKGEIIYDLGSVNKWVSFIEKGAVIAFDLSDRKKTVYEFFFEHQFTGDYESFLTSRPANYGIEALEDCELYHLHFNSLQKLYERFPEYERVGRLIAEAQFLRVTQKNAKLMGEKPEGRYLNLIKEREELIQRVPQYYVASYLGVTPEALSRIRKRLVSK